MGKIDLSQYGYSSRAAFLRDSNPDTETMKIMANNPVWSIAKSVLLHPACPLDVRDRFSRDPIWYKRLVAMFATKAPEGYVNKAARDSDKRIQSLYKRYVDAVNQQVI